mgnify:CR=1 FL=1
MGYYDNIPEIETNLDGSELRIGIVMSRFNIEIGEGLLGACTAELVQLGVQSLHFQQANQTHPNPLVVIPFHLLNDKNG